MNSTNDLKHNLKILLSEWREFTFPTFHPRDFPFPLLKQSRILSIVGPRRAGKTYLCYQIMRHLMDQGAPRKNLLFMNFEDERLHPLSGNELTYLLEAYEELHPWDPKEPLTCVLDEIQNVPNWSKWARRATEQNPNIQIVLTGSSSKLLSAELATELRGRGLSFTLFPYSFREWVRSRGVEPSVTPSTLYGRQKNAMTRLFHAYFKKGGFPEACEQEDPTLTLQTYYQAMFLRDLVERYRIQNVRLFEDFLKIQITRFGSLSSISQIHKDLTAAHGTVSKGTLSNYQRFAREIFLLFEASRYDPKVKSQLLFPKKIYGIDHGLLNAIRFSTSEDRGRLLENAVFLELKRRGWDLYYHKGEAECDFLLKKGHRVDGALQVCWSLQKQETRDREIRGLIEALDTYRCKEGLIVTENETEDIKEGGHMIRVRPFWYFALDH